MNRRDERGITILESLMGAVIIGLVVAGTMTAFVTAIAIARNAIFATEGAAFAVQTIERFRNHIACDDAWLNPANCGFAAAIPWTADPLPGGALGSTLPGGVRVYRVTPGPDDFDGDGLPDYLVVNVQVSWTPP